MFTHDDKNMRNESRISQLETYDPKLDLFVSYPRDIGQIIGHQTSHVAWTALKKIFSTSSKAKIMQLKLVFQTTRKGSLSMMEYILKLKSLTNTPITIGEPVL